MGQKLTVALIGLGGIIARAHMLDYLSASNIEIAPICDILPQKIEAIKNNFGLDAIPYKTNFKELI